MSAAHSHTLYRHGDSTVHRLPPQCKVVSLLLFVLVVVSTPREQFWAFGGYLILIAIVAALARVPPGFLAPRMLVELPFVIFALALPFLATGEHDVEVLGLAMSGQGLLGAFNILAKGTLGVLGALLLAATTEARDLLAGLERLRAPRVMVMIATSMLRYLQVVTDDLTRMRVAMASRGAAGSPRQLRTLGACAGSLFIRTFERGERVHLAMLSRGYSGRMPQWGLQGSPGAGTWMLVLLLPLAALPISVVAAWLSWTVG